jgi:hypothetical protein
MTTLTTQARIEDYKKAYYDYHGAWPLIRKHGAWLKINQSHTSFRSSDLPAMTLRLMEMTIKKKRKEKEDQKIRELKIRTPKWKELPEETINLFMNKLYEDCENSLYKMERCMLNLACNNFKSDGLEEERDCDECDVIDSLEREMQDHYQYLQEQMEEIERKNKELKEDNINLTQENQMLIKKNKHLKENSVLFSMEDFNFKSTMNDFEPDPIEYIDDDDEIPF